MGSLHQHSVRFILSLSLSLSSLSSLSLLSPPSPSLYLSLFSPSLSLSISLYLSLSLLSLSLYLSLSISLLSLLPRTIAYILIHHTHSLTLSHNRYYQSTEPSVMERHIYSISIELNNTATKKQLSPSAGWWTANFAPFSAEGALYVLSFGGNGNYQQVPYTTLLNTANPGKHLFIYLFFYLCVSFLFKA
mgnify:CR=1 FL=1